MIAEKPVWIRHEGLPIFSIDVQPNGERFATGGGDHKVPNFHHSVTHSLLMFSSLLDWWIFCTFVCAVANRN